MKNNSFKWNSEMKNDNFTADTMAKYWEKMATTQESQILHSYFSKTEPNLSIHVFLKVREFVVSKGKKW